MRTNTGQGFTQHRIYRIDNNGFWWLLTNYQQQRISERSRSIGFFLIVFLSILKIIPQIGRDPHRLALSDGRFLRKGFETGDDIQEFIGNRGLALIPELGLKVVRQFQDFFLGSLHGHQPCCILGGQ